MDKQQWTQASEQLLMHLQRSGITRLPVPNAQMLGEIAAWPIAIAKPDDRVVTPRETVMPPANAVSETRPAPHVLAAPPILAQVTERKSPPWDTPSLPETARAIELEALNDVVKACRKCTEIVCQRQQTVFGIGPRNPRLVMFGEAPGAEEDRKGEPFVGPAGQLLDKILAASGLSRSSVYIMNSLKCRPPGNRNPSEVEIENCRPFFERQLEILQPEYIVCWGSIAAKSVLRTSDSIGRLRGRFYMYKQAKVMVTYHPSYLLRTPEAKKLTWEDMKMLMRALEA